MIKNEYDLLKTLAVLLVILGHITIIYKDSYEVLEILTTIIYISYAPFHRSQRCYLSIGT